MRYYGKELVKRCQKVERKEAAKQTVSMLIIDKKRMKLKDAGLPAIVLEQTPKLLRGSKLPIVKAKIGPPKNFDVQNIVSFFFL